MSPWTGLQMWGQLFWCREEIGLHLIPTWRFGLSFPSHFLSAFAKWLMDTRWKFCPGLVPFHRPSATTTCMWGREMSTWNTNRGLPTPRSSEAANNVLIEHASQGKQNIQFYLECFMYNVQRSISIHDIDLSFSYEFHRFRMGISLTILPGRPDLSTIRTTNLTQIGLVVHRLG